MENMKIDITMLGAFTMRAEYMAEPVAVSLSGRSRRLWTLVAYLIINKSRGVSARELIDVLWPDGAGADPTATLHNNVSRVRTALKERGFKNAKELIVFDDGLYYWAPHCTTVLDVDEFEAAVLEPENDLEFADNEEAERRALEKGLTALALYKGNFLSGASSEPWAVNLGMYYRSTYTRLAQMSAQRFSELERHDEVERICTQALAVDPMIEEFSIYLMRSLIAGGNSAKALEHYNATKHLFMETYGVEPSAELEIEYAAALHHLYGEQLPEENIRAFLTDDRNQDGAFYCNNAVFREIAQLYMHEVERSKNPVQIVAIGVEDTSEKDTAKAHERMAVNMRRLKEAISKSLRAGDPFTKMSSAQFLILLPSATGENVQMILDRVAACFKDDYPLAKVEFKFSIFDLLSLM